MPTAIVLPYAGTNAPQGFLFCVGQTLLVADYTDLHNAIGYTYGGSGSSFKLPDLRGRVIAGKDNMEGTSADRLTGLTGGVDGDVLGGTGGDEKHDLTEAQMPKHYHQMRGPNAVTAPQGGETSGTGVYGVEQQMTLLKIMRLFQRVDRQVQGLVRQEQLMVIPTTMSNQL